MRYVSFLLVLLFFASSGMAQIIGGSFKKGYYYDLDGQKIEGFINQKPSVVGRASKAEKAILFKSTKDAEKQLVYASDIQSYVVAADSFAVITPPAVLRSRYQLDFARVLFDEDEKVFLIEEKASPAFGIGAGTGGVMPSVSISNAKTRIYMYGTTGDSLGLLDRRNFKEVLSSILKDYPDLLNKLNNKKTGFEDIESLSEEYMSKKGL